MHHFVALVWNERSQGQTKAATYLSGALRSAPSGWDVALDGEGLLFLHKSERPGSSRLYCLDGGAGVLVGTLFARRDGRSTVVGDRNFDATRTRRIVTTGGKSLLEDHWGRYVAFLHDRDRKRYFVLRDPSGQCPCFHVRIGGIDAYLSDPSDIIPLLPHRPTFNWQFLAANLSVRELVLPETGICGVSELLPGECHESGSAALERRLYWEPAQVC